jgi:3'-5' exonuclease
VGKVLRDGGAREWQIELTVDALAQALTDATDRPD